MDQTKPPLVSVIVPAYNVAGFIGDALNSVLAQTFTDYEIIVINDGSPDTETLEKVLAPYLSRIVYLKQENRGVSAARNTGIKAARGSLIAFLDGDDTWLPHYLEVQVPRIQADPTIDVLYPNVIMFGDSSEAGEEFMTICPSNGEVTLERLLLQECNVSNCSIARRETILRAGLFDESLRSVEDFDLWLRLAHKGARIGYQTKILAGYRYRSDSISANRIKLHEAALRVLQKTRARLRLNDSEKEALDLTEQKLESILILERAKTLIVKGQVAEARAVMAKARKTNNSWKISVALVLLHTFPGLLGRYLKKRHHV